MSKAIQYQMRVRKDVTNDLSHEMAQAFAAIGGGTAEVITSFVVNLSSIDEVLARSKEIDALKDHEIISIILIDTDNSDQLGEDFDWGDDEDEES